MHAEVHAKGPVVREVHEQVLADGLDALDRASRELGHLATIVERERAQRLAGQLGGEHPRDTVDGIAFRHRR